MPLIEVTCVAGTLTAASRASLAPELTRAVLRAERAPETEFVRAVTWLQFHEASPTDFFVGGTTADRPVARVEVTLPAGLLSERRRHELVAETGQLMSAAIGAPPDEVTRVWTIVHEVPDGHWAAGGRPMTLKRLGELVAGSP